MASSRKYPRLRNWKSKLQLLYLSIEGDGFVIDVCAINEVLVRGY